FEALQVKVEEVLSSPPCDVVVVNSSFVQYPLRTALVALRGGPYAELALRLALSLRQMRGLEITTLHMRPPQMEDAQRDAAFRGLKRVLDQLPEIRQEEIETDAPAEVIREFSRHFDLVVLGASARPHSDAPSMGPVAERIMKESQRGVMVVKTRRIPSFGPQSEELGQAAISILVDKWFAENTFHASEFDDLDYLLKLKQKQGVSISLALPALNEEETVGNVICTLKDALVSKVPLVDEIVLMDSNSTDRTREIAQELGIPVYIHQEVLPAYGARHGKGEALWKSLYCTRGDLIIWIDTDIVNIHPRFVYGLIGPFLLRPEICFVKGFYRRPIKVNGKLQASGGGRVTELVARPLLNLFYPELSGVVQPLAGE
ncbi:MAG: glycosyltransferase, partial [Anaerolineales bacterium]